MAETAKIERKMVYSRQKAVVWFLLSFQAGVVNTGGFMALHRFVSHITGFATYVGLELANGEFLRAGQLVSVPLFFIVGSMCSALLIDRQKLLGRRPSYLTAMGLVSLCFLIVAIAGHLGHFGKFGAPLEIYQDYIVLVLLCLACGMQNAIVTSVSGAVVRTTHLTGISTDLGIGLIRILFSYPQKEKLKKEIKANWLRGGLILFFILGSTLGAISFKKLHYLGHLLPFCISIWVAFKLHYWDHWEKKQQKKIFPD